jgi:hypothetical protein
MYLHTYNRFEMSFPGALARLESPEDAPPPIGEKKRNRMTSQSSSFGPF